jgi:hypothetical protein
MSPLPGVIQTFWSWRRRRHPGNRQPNNRTNQFTDASMFCCDGQAGR